MYLDSSIKIGPRVLLMKKSSTHSNTETPPQHCYLTPINQASNPQTISIVLINQISLLFMATFHHIITNRQEKKEPRKNIGNQFLLETTLRENQVLCCLFVPLLLFQLELTCLSRKANNTINNKAEFGLGGVSLNQKSIFPTKSYRQTVTSSQHKPVLSNANKITSLVKVGTVYHQKNTNKQANKQANRK